MAPGSTSPVAPLSIDGVARIGARVEARVLVSEPRYLRTAAFPALPGRVLERFPEIVRHRCECGSARGIEAELRDTETPHVLEHIALEVMVAAGAPRTLAGRTSWDFARDGKGVFCVAIACEDPDSGFEDEALAGRALYVAAAVLNEMLES